MLIMQPITNGSSGEGRKSWRKLLPQIYGMDSKYIRRESADKCERGSGGLCAAAQNVLTRLYSFCKLGETSEYYHHDMYHLLASRSIEALQRVEELGNRITNDGTVNPVKQDIIAIYGNMIPAYKQPD